MDEEIIMIINYVMKNFYFSLIFNNYVQKMISSKDLHNSDESKNKNSSFITHPSSFEKEVPA